MILDERLEFADATALGTSGTGRAIVGDTIDLGDTISRVGGDALRQMYLVIQVTTSVDSSGDGATVSFELVTNATSTMAADGSDTENIVTEAIAQATLVAGYTRVIPLTSVKGERYMGLLQNVGVEALTAGAINAFLTADPHGWHAYPDAAN